MVTGNDVLDCKYPLLVQLIWKQFVDGCIYHLNADDMVLEHHTSRRHTHGSTIVVIGEDLADVMKCCTGNAKIIADCVAKAGEGTADRRSKGCYLQGMHQVATHTYMMHTAGTACSLDVHDMLLVDMLTQLAHVLMLNQPKGAKQSVVDTINVLYKLRKESTHILVERKLKTLKSNLLFALIFADNTGCSVHFSVLGHAIGGVVVPDLTIEGIISVREVH